MSTRTRKLLDVLIPIVCTSWVLALVINYLNQPL